MVTKVGFMSSFRSYGPTFFLAESRQGIHIVLLNVGDCKLADDNTELSASSFADRLFRHQGQGFKVLC